MKRRFFVLTVLALAIALCAGTSHAQPPPRLIADNKTAYYVDVLTWNGKGWNFVVRLNPRAFTTFPGALNGSLWRAVIGQVVRDHTVRYVYDPGYRGYQDVWLIQ